MLINKTQLQRVMVYAGPAVVDKFLPHINAAMAEFKITTARAQAHFLAQLSHETGSLSRLSENLNYSKAERLMVVWPSRFKTLASAEPYVRNPEKLANFVYAGRMGNGTPESGDGWRYRGAGAFQLTGKNNHMACAKQFNITPANIGDWLRSPEGAMRSAAWFFVTSGALVQAELGRLDKVCDIINLGRMTDKVGDSIGYAERNYLTNTALNALDRGVA
jgi:putative chitinase